MEIMIQHIKKLLPILIIIFISCKKTETAKHFEINRKTNIEDRNIPNKYASYKLWQNSSKNTNKKFQNLKIYLSSDSIMIFDSEKMICSGEIVQKRNTFSQYFKSSNTAENIKEQLNEEFKITVSDEIEVVMNSYGDISGKGCQFPFNELFIVDNQLFFYDKGYYCFENNDEEAPTNKRGTISFPSKSIKKDDLLSRPSKFPLINKQIIIDDSSATSVYKLSENVYITWFDGDTERWYLVTINDSKIVSKLLIGKSETVETERGTIDNYIDFTIDKDYKINLEYSTGKNTELKKIEKEETYYVNPKDNKIVKFK
ncbi:hypothetical protein [Chryseobacterium sp. JAH]|uniref:hypothetical protein n=1 Tax=Chryseobacterium sp. JAH TaxID=1742858 RepID=UPI000740FE48|nr:hypothetical protein [Chryseobacterium sp. JAH]KUJ50301.1 hypothetical protein AR685_15260 [Chryseobacterium sp. JAH]